MSVEQKQTLGFQTEVKQILHLVTHSLYSNKEIFLRELISNASDANDKLRFEALSNSTVYENDPELKIWVDFDPKEKTITVRDNGIGMSHDEVVSNLGTIAKSGTKEFLAALSSNQAKDANLIGQFGVGFYSSFVVADKVIVKTRRAGYAKEQGVQWESNGEGEFTVSSFEKPNRGTEVILHLKPDENEFLDFFRLKTIITKYSDHIMHPIIMIRPPEEKNAIAKEEAVNKATALWSLPKKDIKDEEYKELYRHISHDFEDPLIWSHNQVEGNLEYTTLLYIPSHPAFDFGRRETRRGLKLYVRRVFILDEAETLLPNYLRFVRGIVDSKDLPLNVSREILQTKNHIIEQLRSGIIKRVLDILEGLATQDPEKYAKFWRSFGRILKEGLVEDFTNQKRIAKLLRFSSTKTDSEEQNVSLDEYIEHMPADQDKVYYITTESFNDAKNCPYLEIFRKKNIEVLLLTERVDEWWVAHFSEYEGKKLQSIAKGDIDLTKFTDEKENKEKEVNKTNYDDLLKKMQKVLDGKVKEVRISERLVDSPVCMVVCENDMSYNLQRILSDFGQDTPKTKPILEINPKHTLIHQLINLTDDNLFTEWANLFYEQAVLTGGGKLDNSAEFIKRLNKLLVYGHFT